MTQRTGTVDEDWEVLMSILFPPPSGPYLINVCRSAVVFYVYAL